MPETVIIIERDILVRMVLADYLRECGYKVIEGVSTTDVWTVLEGGRQLDVVLADISDANNTDAFELARKIRASHTDIDVILTSTIAKAAHKANDLCEEGPLEKPYSPQEVIRRIQLLRKKGKAAKRS